ncbi:hypothetical protein KFK09_010906 [Dendrobium nobile]|uniref:Uncharacterized protein n=1 Tax=Dendrobium nobile TaxID=94219 RepID=A0A8T3BED5_DENNO|nr:hypothetical protein KFK09_010906 [Dendrobium nobile]
MFIKDHLGLLFEHTFLPYFMNSLQYFWACYLNIFFSIHLELLNACVPLPKRKKAVLAETSHKQSNHYALKENIDLEILVDPLATSGRLKLSQQDMETASPVILVEGFKENNSPKMVVATHSCDLEIYGAF